MSILKTMKFWWHSRRLIKSGNSNVRWKAAEALGKLGDTQAVEPLIKALDDKKWDVRESAAEALGELGDTRAVEPLIKALDDKEWGIRKSAAKALGKLGDTRAVEPLIKALGDGYPYVRESAAEALALLGESKWKTLVKGDGDDFDRLGRSNDPAAFEPLIKALGDGNSNVRWKAAEALGNLGDTRAVEPLIKALGDGNWSAAKALGKLGDIRAIEPLIKALNDRSKYAAEALGKLGDTRAVEPLIKALNDRNWDVCGEYAAEALGNLGDTRAVGALIKALGDGGWHVRKNAAEALGKLSDTRAVAPLIKALGDGNSDVRKRAAEALALLGEPKWKTLVQGDRDDFDRLGKSNDPAAFELLIEALGDSNYDVREKAAEALGKLGDTRAIEPLIKALGDHKKYVREKAAEALKILGFEPRTAHERALIALTEERYNDVLLEDPQSVTLLVDALSYCDEEGFTIIAGILESLSKSAVDPLICKIHNRGGQSSYRCAVILGRIRDERAVPSLIDILNKYPVVEGSFEEMGHNAARRALRNIGTPNALAAVRKSKDYVDRIQSHYAQLSINLVAKHGKLIKLECLPGLHLSLTYQDGSVIRTHDLTNAERVNLTKKLIESKKFIEGYDINSLRLGYVGTRPRYAEHFLQAAGCDLTYEEIATIKVGDIVKIKKGRAIILRNHSL